MTETTHDSANATGADTAPEPLTVDNGTILEWACIGALMSWDTDPESAATVRPWWDALADAIAGDDPARAVSLVTRGANDSSVARQATDDDKRTIANLVRRCHVAATHARNDIRTLAYGMPVAARRGGVWHSFARNVDNMLRPVAAVTFPDAPRMPVGIRVTGLDNPWFPSGGGSILGHVAPVSDMACGIADDHDHLRTLASVWSWSVEDRGAAIATLQGMPRHLADTLRPAAMEDTTLPGLRIVVVDRLSAAEATRTQVALTEYLANLTTVVSRAYADISDAATDAAGPLDPNGHDGWCGEYERSAAFLCAMLSFAPEPPEREPAEREYRVERTYTVTETYYVTASDEDSAEYLARESIGSFYDRYMHDDDDWTAEVVN